MLDTSDESWITEDLFKKEKPMEPTYNKVQYSEFTPDRVGQWVLRGDTLQEVLDLKKELTDKLSVGKPVLQAPVSVTSSAPQTATYASTQPPQTQYKDLTVEETITKYNLTDMVAMQMRTPCKRCGSVSAYNPKTGKVFCQKKCWLNK